MEKKMATIEDLLNALRKPTKEEKELQNSKSTWERIGNKDDFSELGLSPTELSDFLKEWINDNPYNNI